MHAATRIMEQSRTSIVNTKRSLLAAMHINFWRFIFVLTAVEIVVTIVGGLFLSAVAVDVNAILPFGRAEFYLRIFACIPLGIIAWLLTVVIVGGLYDTFFPLRWQLRGYLPFVLFVAFAATAVFTFLWQVIYSLTGIQPRDLGLVFFPMLAFSVVLVAIFWIKFGARLSLQNFLESTSAPKILDQLAPDKRGKIVFLQAQGHYVRVVTSVGESLIRSKLADAVKECAPTTGMKVHRSFWVSDHYLSKPVKDGRRWFMNIGEERISVSSDFAESTAEPCQENELLRTLCVGRTTVFESDGVTSNTSNIAAE